MTPLYDTLKTGKNRLHQSVKDLSRIGQRPFVHLVNQLYQLSLCTPVTGFVAGGNAVGGSGKTKVPF
jgi:hypothetical protein